ncbi:MAG: glycosyltransferase [Verrucomicrobiales bacterium]|jgi:glycosyltransferase involved in cell wall biosynthesis|nr:glycosyltransferase [Verrucomicrobiales bacterium]
MKKAIVVSPYAHLAGHHWSVMEKLVRYMQSKGVVVDGGVTCFSQHIKNESGIHARAILPKWQCIYQLLGERLLHYKKIQSILQNLETFMILIWANKHTRKNQSVIYCVDARHVILALFVIFTRQRYVHYLWGMYENKHNVAGRIKILLYKWAFDTGRLDFIAETNDVEISWRDVGARTAVIPYAIEKEFSDNLPDRHDSRKQLGLDLNKRIFLLFGTHRQDKDYRTVIRAAKVLLQRDFAVHLVFAGAVISENDPVKLLQEEDFSEATVITGYVDEQKTRLLFAASDAVILPYPKDYKKGSGVLLEAVCHERPVIVSSGGYLESFVTTYSTGLSYKPADSDDLANVLMDQRLMNCFWGTERFKRVKDEYSWSTLIERHLSFLD